MVLGGRISVLAFLIALSPNLVSPLPAKEAQASTKSSAHVDKAVFGTMPDGTKIESFTITNTLGSSAKVITYGASLAELHVPDRNGKIGDVVLGFDTLDGYLGKHPHFGGTIGRYGNRIAKGKFTLDGKEYQLALNNGPNSLHGGPTGFDKRVWKGEALEKKEDRKSVV